MREVKGGSKIAMTSNTHCEGKKKLNLHYNTLVHRFVFEMNAAKYLAAGTPTRPHWGPMMFPKLLLVSWGRGMTK